MSTSSPASSRSVSSESIGFTSCEQFASAHTRSSGVGVGVVVDVGVGVSVGTSVSVGAAVDVGVGDGEGVNVGVGDGDSVGDGVGVHVGNVNDTPTIGSRSSGGVSHEPFPARAIPPEPAELVATITTTAMAIVKTRANDPYILLLDVGRCLPTSLL